VSIFSTKSDGFQIRMRFSQYLVPLYIGIDLFVLHIGVDIFSEKHINILSHTNQFTVFLLLILPYLISIIVTEPYKIYRLWNLSNVTKKFVFQQSLFIVGLFCSVGITETKLENKMVIAQYLAIVILILFLIRVITFLFLQKYRSLGYNHRNIILIGNDEKTKELKLFFQQKPKLGYRLCGIYHHKPTKLHLGNLDDFRTTCLQKNIHEVFISIESMEKKQIQKLISFAENLFISVKIIPVYSPTTKIDSSAIYMGNVCVVPVTNVPIENELNDIAKRLFDIIFSSIVIVTVLSWFLPLAALIIKLDSKGPVLFIQLRSGLNNIPFRCLKLRTMKVNSESCIKQAERDDKRITRVGDFLRKTSLDEFPQFINVFLGHMSIVGPRPHMLKHTEEYAKIIDRYMVRHFIKPGITGLSQIKGYRGNTEDTRLMINRIKLDIFYMEKWSFFLDLKIIFLTAINLIKGQDNAL
jgi:putative colanic acid biosynthesis UDP-glucose lipid carrier transferase